MAASPVYAIGDQKNGLIIVVLDPPRVLKIGRDTIHDFMKKIHLPIDAATEEKVFANIGRSALQMIIGLAAKKVVANIDDFERAHQEIFDKKTVLTQANFCLYGEVDWGKEQEMDRELGGRQRSYSMLHDVVQKVLTPKERWPASTEKPSLSKDHAEH